MPTVLCQSGVGVSATVDNPASSKRRAASPTDWQQKGQAGVRITASTPSAFMFLHIGSMASVRNSVLFH